MVFDPWTEYRVREERMKDAMRREEQAQLIRETQRPGRARGGRLWMAAVIRSVSAIFTSREGGAPSRRSMSTASRPTVKG
jgi:hypothetical protein